MRILGVKLYKPSDMARRLLYKKPVDIPMEFHDDIYNKLSEHKRAFDYFTNRYGITFSFTEQPKNHTADVYCIKRNIFRGEGKWAKTTISSQEDFADSARSIYKTIDEILKD